MPNSICIPLIKKKYNEINGMRYKKKIECPNKTVILYYELVQ